MNRIIKYINIKYSRGFTLIEVILSLALISIIAISFLSVFQFINTWVINSMDSTIQNNILISIVENIKSGSIYEEISNIDLKELEDYGYSNFVVDNYHGNIVIQPLNDNIGCFVVSVNIFDDSGVRHPKVSTIINNETYNKLFK